MLGGRIGVVVLHLVGVRLIGQPIELAEPIHGRPEVVGDDEDAAGLDVLPDAAEEVALFVGNDVMHGQHARDGVVRTTDLGRRDVARPQLHPVGEAVEALAGTLEHLGRDVQAGGHRNGKGVEDAAQCVAGAGTEVEEAPGRSQGEQRQQRLVDLLVAREHLADLGVVPRCPLVEMLPDRLRLNHPEKYGRRGADELSGR